MALNILNYLIKSCLISGTVNAVTEKLTKKVVFET
jgi:hypothetical protein